MENKINFKSEYNYNFLLEILEKANNKIEKDSLSNKIKAYTQTEIYNENKITVYLFEKLPKNWKDILSNVHYLGKESKQHYIDFDKTKKKYFKKVFIEIIPIKKHNFEKFSEEYGLLTAQIQIENKNYKLLSNIISGINYPVISEKNEEFQLFKYESELI